MMERTACRNCGSLVWWAMRTICEGGEFIDSCSECGGVRTSSEHDVYFKAPYWENHIAPAPVFIESKRQKAALLKKHGLREAGDRVRGSNGFDGISHRAAQKSLQKGDK